MNGRWKMSWLLVACGIAVSVPAIAEEVAIVGATVHVAPGTVIEGATVLIRNGRIAAVGKAVAVPAKARRVDAAGRVVTAGFIDAATRIGLVEIESEATTREGQFAPARDDDVHAAYRVTEGYNASSVAIPVARVEGVTSVLAVPVGGLIAGAAAWMSLAEPQAASQVVRAPATMIASVRMGADEEAGSNHGAAFARLRELFDDVAQYQRNRAAFNRNQSRPMAAGRLDLEALVPVLRRQVPLMVYAHRRSDIAAAIGLSTELGLRLVVAGAAEAWMLADELARANVAVILDPSANLPSSFERIYARSDTAKILADAGVEVIISTLGEASNVRTLRQMAGLAARDGMTFAQALAAVTETPAAVLGVPGRGTLTVGSPADVVVWSGDPFELATRAEHVFIDGVPQSLVSRQTLLFERYRSLR